MASKLCVLLSLALIANIFALPVPDEDIGHDETTTIPANSDVALIDEIEVIDVVPAIEIITDTATEAETNKPDHKVAKRSALRGDNPSNDLLADFDGIKYETGLSSLAGRRIKFLPTWLG